MKNDVKSSKHFFGYFNTLETHSGITIVKFVFSKKDTKIDEIFTVDLTALLGAE